ncbi:MAG: hypothetical protein Q9195_007591 [Heterodermia aff. obscurata]
MPPRTSTTCSSIFNPTESVIPPGQLESLSYDEIDENLEEAVNALRMKDFYSLLDVTNLAVWVFQVPGHTSEDHQKKRQSELGRLVSRYGLISRTTGAIKSSDLLNDSESIPSIYDFPEATDKPSGAQKDPNLEAFEANAQIKLEGFATGEASVPMPHTYASGSIRSMFIESISLSILSSFGLDGRWLRIGVKWCVGPIHDQDHEGKTLWSDFSTNDLSLISIELCWCPSGSLVMAGCKAPALHLAPISKNEGVHKSTLPLSGATVIVAPSGERAIVVGRAPNGYHEMRKSIISRLERQNIKITSQTEWLKLQIPGEDLDELLLIIWPAHLCFSNPSRSRVDFQEESLRRVDSVQRWVDPLELAERWYNGRAARADAIEAKRKANEKLVEVVKEYHESDDEGMLVYVEAISNGRLNLQDMSGVYPTPPDAAPPGTQEHNNRLETGEMASITANSIQGPSPLAASPIFNETPSFNNDGDGDLFGEIDSEMFAANGLTEDDFNFFDEPSADETEAVDAQQSTISLNFPNQAGTVHNSYQHLSPDFNDALDSGPGVDQPPESDDTIQSLTNRKTGELSLCSGKPHWTKTEADPDQEQSDATNGIQTAPSTDLPEMTTAVDDGIPKLPVKSDLSSMESFMKAPRFETQGHGKLLQESLRRGPGNVFHDHKYGENGYFGFENIGTPEGKEPGKLSEREKLEILNTETLHDSDASLSESTDNQDLETESDQSEIPEEAAIPHAKEHEAVGRLPEAFLKRKRERSFGDDVPMSPTCSHQSVISPDDRDQNSVDMPELTLFTRTSSKPPTELLDPLEDHDVRTNAPSLSLDPKIYLRIAQLVCDQVGQSSTEILGRFPNTLSAYDKQHDDNIHRDNSVIPFEALLQRTFPKAQQWSLTEVLAEERRSLAVKPIETPSTQSSSKKSTVKAQMINDGDEKEKPFKMKIPLAHVRRMDSQIDISISALQFWEELGLAPTSTEKNVTVHCIHPESQYIGERVVCFLESVKNAYQSCKLGTHRMGVNLTGHDRLLTAVPMSSSDTAYASDKLFEACESLGRKLATSQVEGTNFGIYIINPCSSLSSLPQLCNAFLRLFEAYASALKGQKLERPCDVILQILPLAAIASNLKLVIPSPATYKKVAFEVYNRCAPPQELDLTSPYTCAPAVQLAGTIPRSIDFALSSTPIAGLSHLDRCVHVGYCWLPHASWLSASWTDNQGHQQWNACYRIATDQNQSWPTLEETIKEMWDTTIDLIGPKNAPWRIFIAKSKSMSRQELDCWLSISSQSSCNTTVAILVIVESPSLQFPPSRSLPLNLLISSLATPALTPAANTVSPEYSGYPSTPGAGPVNGNLPTPTATSFDHDRTARLVDVSEETWGVVMAGTIANAPWDPDQDSTASSPPRFSGHLMKRAGVRDGDGLVNIRVDILQAANASQALLKEVLEMYGSLGTLARMRGIVDPVKSVLPWHIAIAKKSYAALQTMGTEEGVK